MPVAAGAGDTNICGGIIQLYWNNILEICLDVDDQIRQTALKVGTLIFSTSICWKCLFFVYYICLIKFSLVIAFMFMFQILEVVLRQGLVHPITCVPCLIALEIDPLEVNSKLAHHLLMNMNEKYVSFYVF